jgi:hypothetical protein
MYDKSEKYYTQYNPTTQILELQIYHTILINFSTDFQFAPCYLHMHAIILANGQSWCHIYITIFHINIISSQNFNNICLKPECM